MLLVLLAVCGSGCGGPDDGRTEAARLVGTMDLRGQATQLVVGRLAASADSAASARQRLDVADGRLTGVWVDGGDAREVAATIAGLRRVSPGPLLVAAPIDRGSPLGGATRLPPAAVVARLASPDDAESAGVLAAAEARAVGIDLGFVAVPPTNASGPLTYAARAPGITGGGLRGIVSAARSTGLAVGVVAFWAEEPDAPLLTWDRARLDAVELTILRETLAAGPEAVAAGPLRLPALTGDSTPLPISPAAVRGVLRRDMGFDGVIVADLGPESPLVLAIGAREAAVRAIDAGADLLIRVDDPAAVVDAIVVAVQEGRLRGARVRDAAVRTLSLKLSAAEESAPVHPDSLEGAIGTRDAAALAARLEAAVAAPVLPAPAPELHVPERGAEADSLAALDPDGLAEVDALLRTALDDSVFTAATLAVGRRGALVRLTGYGAAESNPASVIFDIASLTKVIATATAVALLVESGEMDLDAPVRRYLPEWRGEGKGDVTVRHLLTHTSGLPSGLWLFGSARSAEQAFEQTLEQRLMRDPGETVEYSDLGMIILARAVERAAGMPIDQLLALRVFAPLGMQRTMFLPPLAVMPEIVPTAEFTERDFVLHGVVHDANAFRLGGVAGHAGLFSTALDLAIFAQMILNGGAYGTTQVLAPGTITAFTTRQPDAGTRALGWDTPADRSAASRLFSARAYGHTGYTGTSLWIDPELDLFVVLLTNRTFTGASAGDILRLRAELHYAVADAVTDATVQPRPGSRPVR